MEEEKQEIVETKAILDNKKKKGFEILKLLEQNSQKTINEYRQRMQMNWKQIIEFPNNKVNNRYFKNVFEINI